MRRKNLAPEYTNVCSHCGKNLHTKQEYADGRCDSCQEAYDEEMYAIYGDDLYIRIN
jgi:predicted RNA-binding Zn-ribbon protein involved in translation (DUF1610 family)